MSSEPRAWLEAGGTTPETLVFVNDDCALVKATPFLNWQPAAPSGRVARVSLMTFQLLRYMLGRCDISRGGPEETAAESINLLTLRLPADCWTRILKELTASGLATELVANQCKSTADLDKILEGLKIATPAALLLTVADLATAGEPFDTPAVAGRGQTQGTPAVDGPTHLKFLAELGILDLLRSGESSPFQLVCRLAGMLGPCLTAASRLVPRNTASLVARLMKVHITKIHQLGDGDDELLVQMMPDHLHSLTLPVMFRELESSVKIMESEALDTITYQNSPEGRKRIEARRLKLTEPW